ncbi:WhiB family transcriptional regulator [Streptomyces sp. NPDC050504]|uniref:WhiB family transcriptional regulator n=1 Tax=Streptomyces sp. NPDC050504 TaxID=3365618 RepID=UPI00379F10E4
MPTLTTLTDNAPRLPCRTDPDRWHSPHANDRRAAVEGCQPCPVRAACARYALDHPEVTGVWGGTTTAQRRSWRDGRPWRFDEQGRLRLVCGSEEAYRSHFGYREQPCVACVAAHEAHIGAGRRARLAEAHRAAGGGSAAGYWLHRRLGEVACAACVAAVQARRPARQARRGARPPAVAAA